ncbi:hypothetical protein PINS_up001258 [Pythium insidiosum]|nr:hypothetical protein PINS_up001258 [Pythium insidiosum]
MRYRTSPSSGGSASSSQYRHQSRHSNNSNGGGRRRDPALGIVLLDDSTYADINGASHDSVAPRSPSSSACGIFNLGDDHTVVPGLYRSRSASHAATHRSPLPTSGSSTTEDTPRRRARKILRDEDAESSSTSTSSNSRSTGRGHSSASSADVPAASHPANGNGSGAGSGSGSGKTNSGDSPDPKPRPVRIKYESNTRGIGGGKREISHASLGKLVARLTDAHQYDVEFRDVFLLTYRCFCSPYDFIKKLMKRYTAVLTLCGGLDASVLEETQALLDQITRDEENERSSTSTSISTAKSDINTGVEANVSIMRLLSVVKYWIKESGFIDADLQDRRTQKKLLALLTEIKTTTPIPSIRSHAESLLSVVTHLVRQHHHQQQLHASHHHIGPPRDGGELSASLLSQSPPVSVPPPPPLSASSSVSSLAETTVS